MQHHPPAGSRRTGLHTTFSARKTAEMSGLRFHSGDWQYVTLSAPYQPDTGRSDISADQQTLYIRELLRGSSGNLHKASDLAAQVGLDITEISRCSSEVKELLDALTRSENRHPSDVSIGPHSIAENGIASGNTPIVDFDHVDLIAPAIQPRQVSAAQQPPLRQLLPPPATSQQHFPQQQSAMPSPQQLQQEQQPTFQDWEIPNQYDLTEQQQQQLAQLTGGGERYIFNGQGFHDAGSILREHEEGLN
jgi:hypothetical protein